MQRKLKLWLIVYADKKTDWVMAADLRAAERIAGFTGKYWYKGKAPAIVGIHEREPKWLLEEHPEICISDIPMSCKALRGIVEVME